MSNGYSIVEVLIKEAEAYASIDRVDSLIQSGADLASLPVQPLYNTIKSMTPEKVSNLLPRLTLEQRQIFIDLDLWKRDQLDIEEFGFWIQSFSRVPDLSVKAEFAQSVEFLIYLKGKLNIWTFDVEEPEYPDHDNYFLTDDQQLLFEFDESYSYVQDVKIIIDALYADLGVENAYAHLFKLVVDSFDVLEEEEYQLKKGRLSELGFVDYYDALEMYSPFHTYVQIEKHLSKLTRLTPEIDLNSLNQIPPRAALIPFKSGFETFSYHLSKVDRPGRRNFLQFDFTRLINGTLSLSDKAKSSSMIQSKTSEDTKYYLALALSYIANHLGSDVVIFDHFDFRDLYRIGLSLIQIERKELKKAQEKYLLDGENEIFLGKRITEMLERSFQLPVKIFNKENFEVEKVDSFEKYKMWKDENTFIKTLIVFISKFHTTFDELKIAGSIQDGFYLNYTVSDIDFEALLLSSFANFTCGQVNPTVKKMGLTMGEYKQFVTLVLDKGGEYIKPDVINSIRKFAEEYGLSVVSNFEYYLLDLLSDHILGYDYKAMSDEEFKHVGGPILLLEV